MSPVGGTFNFSYTLTGIDPIKEYITNETSVISGNFGGLNFSSGYLRSYTLNCQPNKSVVANAEIVFFDELKGVFSPTYNLSNDQNILNFADITVSDPTNGNIGTISNIQQANLSFSSEINPLFLAGESDPQRISFGKKELSASIVTDNYSGDMPLSGRNAGITINFNHPKIPSLTESFTVSGTLFQRTLQTSAGELLTSNLSIRQNYVNFPPDITLVSSLNSAIGDVIEIDGTYLISVKDVTIHKAAASFTINSDNQISVTIPPDATSGDISITNEFGTVNAGFFTPIYSPLSVARLIPNTGEISGRILISGDNFYHISDVKFQSYEKSIFLTGSKFNIIDPTIIEAFIPNFAAWGKVHVISSLRELSGSSPYEFVTIPRINKFTPSSGISGDIITIEGQGFSGITGVLFNNLPNIIPFTTPFTVVSNTGITAEVPTGNVKGKIKLFGQSGVLTSSLRNFSPLARITGLNPSNARTGTAIDILGENFYQSLLYEIGNSNQFLVSFQNATGAFIKINNSRLTGIIPYNASSGIVSIYDSELNKYPSSVSFKLNYEPPVIVNIVSGSGKYLDDIVINGSNFFDLSALKISGLDVITQISSPAPSIGGLGDSIFFKIPQVTGGNYTIIIETPQGNVTGNSLLTILDSGIFSGFSPISGGIGNLITVTGKNIYPTSQVYFNFTGISGESGRAVVDSSSFNINRSQVNVYVPNFALTGFNTIILYNGVDYVSGTGFRLVSSPKISGFNPTSGEIGEQISISGSNLGNVTGIDIGLIPVTTFSSVNNTGINFTIPEMIVPNFITIYSLGETYTTTGKFAPLIPQINISGFKPLSGYVGDIINISGSRMSGALFIRFSGTDNTRISLNGPYFTKVADSGIYVNVPQGAQDGKITITNIRGESQSNEIFIVLKSPQISGFFPNFGAYTENIIVSGSNFGGMDFLFKGVNDDTYIPALSKTIVGGTGVTLQVPKEIITGPIFVSGNNLIRGQSTGNFIPLPTISGFTQPTFLSGSSFIITGINASHFNSGVLFMTGNGIFRQILINNLSGNFSNVSGNGIIDYTSGYALLSGSVEQKFIGTGQIFIINSYFNEIIDTNTFLTSVISGKVNTVKSFNVLDIQESAPDI